MEKTQCNLLKMRFNLIKSVLSLVMLCMLVMGLALPGFATSKEYADTDVAALITDIEAGTYDEYILSTSGGTYDMSDVDLASNITVKAKEFLASKPIVSNSGNTSTFRYFFDIEGAYSLTLQGIKFDGTASTEALSGVVRARGDNANVTITDCEMYNFSTANGVVRLGNAGVSLTMTDSYIYDSYGRLIRIDNSGVVMGDISVTNSTFANITADPALHWVSTGSSTVANITVEQCTFYNIGDKAMNLGTVVGNLTITNSNFDACTGNITIATPGTSSTMDYCYDDGLGSAVGAGITITNEITTAPTYTDAGNLDLTLTNGGSLTGSNAKPIGDPRWDPTVVEAVAEYNDVQTVDNVAASNAQLKSNKASGFVYMILDGEAQSNLTELDNAVTALKGAKATVTTAYTNTAVSTNGLSVGTYYGYAVDGSNNISAKGSNAITVTQYVPLPVVSNTVQSAENGVSDVVNVQSTKSSGYVYVILDGEAQSTIGELDAAVTAKKGAKAAVTAANTDMAISVTDIVVGTYYAYAIDGTDMSVKGTNAITITNAAPTVSAAEQRVNDGAGQTVNVQSSEAAGKVYIIIDGEAQATVGELDVAVSANKGASATVTAANTDIAIATTGIAPGIYYAYAVDADDAISTKGTNKIVVESTTITEKEYADTEVATLMAEIEVGLYSTYILSTSGGDYVAKDIDLAANTIVKAKDGLAAKPKFTNAANTGTYQSFFDLQGSYSIEIEGIDFDGTATEPMAGVVRLRADNATGVLKNCEIKNFTTSSGIVRLHNNGTAISLDSCFVHDCYGRLFRVEKGDKTIGNISLKNSTFAKVTNDPVVHWVTASSSTVNNITIDQCNFYDVKTNVFKLGSVVEPVLITNTIFDQIQDSTEYNSPGATDSMNYCYIAGFGKELPDYFKLKNTITTAPVYTDAATLNFNLTNPDYILGSTGKTPIGDPRWHNQAASPVLAIYEVQSVTNAAGQTVSVKSNKAAGSIYIILDGEAQSTIAEMDAAVTALKGAKVAVTEAYKLESLSTEGLSSGTYYAYAVDGSNNISAKGTNAITVLNAAVPVAVSNEVQAVTNAKDQVALVQSNKPEGTVYIVLDGVAQSTVAELKAAVAANNADSATVTANDTDMSVPTDSLALGTYYAYAVDVDGNLSPKGSNAITIRKGTPEVYADAQAATDAAGQTVNVQSSDNHGKVYIILSGELQDSIPAFEAAVAAKKGAVDTVTASLTNVALSTEGLAVGVYYAYATDSVGNVSAKGSNKITITSSTISSKEYADTAVATLVADIEAGLYDTYVLSTSGGNYVASDIDLISDITVKAKDGLAVKPIFSDASNTGTYRSFFDLQNGKYALHVEGVVFDGTATEALHGVARLRYDSATVVIKNCEIKNFTTTSGIVRLDKTGTAVTLDDCFVHDCYGRLIRLDKNDLTFGDVKLTNSTFAKITDDPVIHWITATSSTANSITVDQCTFFDINDNVFKLGAITEPFKVTNSIFERINDTIEFESPGTTDSINYSYMGGFGGTLPSALIIDNAITTAPVYKDSAALDLSLTNQGFLLGSDGATPIGDPRWHEKGPEPVMVVYDAQSVTNAAGQTVAAMSNKDAGYVYIILEGEAQATLAELNAAVAAGKGAKDTVTVANTNISISTTALTAGTYYAYAVDGEGSISEKGSNAITILDATVPVAVSNAVQTVTNAKGAVAKVQSNKPSGTVYITLSNVAQATIAELNAAIAMNKADSATVTANDTDIEIPTDSLALGTYYAYAVDADGNLSAKGDSAITIIKGAPEVYADAQTVSDAADQYVTVKSSENSGKVYIILDGAAQSTLAEFDAAVTKGKGAVEAVTGRLTGVNISTTGLAVGVYYAYAVDTVGNISAKGTNKLAVVSSTSPFKEYASTEVDALITDALAGLYEMYILSTSGGVYDLPEQLEFNKSAVLMAKPGLAAKPIIKHTAGNNGALGMMRVRFATDDVELVLDGLEFDCEGIPSLVLRSDSKTNLKVQNCYVHHNTNSNGSFRLNTAGSSVNMENCLVTDCKQRVVNFYNNTADYGDVSISNTTVAKLSGEGVVFFRSSSGAYAGGNNVSINHCTFSEIGGDIFRFDKERIAGKVTITNSLFDQVADSLNADVLDYNYLNVTSLLADAGTNTFTTVPIFADSANYNYGLLNDTSYVCADGETVGDLNWYTKPDSVIAIMYSQTTTNLVGDKITAQSNVAKGIIYIVREGEAVSTADELNAAVAANKGDSASITAAYTNVNISVTGLYSGSYYAYVVDANGSISAASKYASVILDWLNVKYQEQTVTNGVGNAIELTTSVSGFAYLVMEGKYNTVADLESAVSAKNGVKTSSIEEKPVVLSVEGLNPGTYYGYAVADTNISLRGENAITINTSLYAETKRQTASNKEGNWSHAFVKCGTVGGNVYMLNKSVEFEILTVEILEQAVADNMAAKDTVTKAEVDFKISTTGLQDGKYRFYMVVGSQISEKSDEYVSVRTPRTYYYVADQAEEMRKSFYNGTITTGDEVVLTTSGGIYNLKTYFRIFGGVYLHAQDGLAEKPVLFYNPAFGGEDVRHFMPLVEFYPPGGVLHIEGIELNGGAFDDNAGNATFGVRIREDVDFNYGYSVVFDDCYFHDFNTQNVSSSGVVSTNGYAFRQGNNVKADSVIINNCIFTNTYNEAVYFRNLTNVDYFDALSISNSTFYGVPSVLGISAPLADSKSVINIDHCTFDSIGVNAVSSRIIKPDNLAYLNMSNCIISNSASQTAGDTAMVAYGNSMLAYNNLYLTPSIVLQGSSQVSNTTAYNPEYYNRAMFNYAPTNASILTADSQGKQLGDPRWAAGNDLKVDPVMRYVSNSELKVVFSQSVDTVSAKIASNYTLSGSVGLTGNPESVKVVAPNAVVITVSDFSNAVDFATVVVEVAKVANVMGDTVMSNANTATYIVPIAVTMEEQILANEVGQSVKATCGSAGSTIYIVPENAIIYSVDDLVTLADSGWARTGVVVEAFTNVNIDMGKMQPGIYYAYAVNDDQTEWSVRSKNSATVRGLEVEMGLQLGLTNAPGQVVVAQSTYNSGNLFIVPDSIEIISVSDLETAVENNDGAVSEVSKALTDIEISIEGINPGRYRVYAESSDSISERSKVLVQIEQYVGIDLESMMDVEIYAYENKAYVETYELQNGDIKVINVMGSITKIINITDARTEIPLEQGIYIISVETENGTKNKRVVIE